jgi:hypothetical protein
MTTEGKQVMTVRGPVRSEGLMLGGLCTWPISGR